MIVLQAPGDGVTDCTAAWGWALGAAKAYGAEIGVPPGRYCMRNLTIDFPVTIRGLVGWGRGDANGACLVAADGLNTDLLTFVPAPGGPLVGVTLENLVLDGNAPAQTAGSVLNAYGAVHCRLVHCHITRPYEAGLFLNHDGAGGTGHHTHVEDCLFDGGHTSAGPGRGVYVVASDEVWFRDCDFENNGVQHAYERSGLQKWQGCNFVGGRGGLKCEGIDNIVSGCMFDGVGGIPLELNGDGTLIAASHFYKVPAGADAILVNNCAETVIAGCGFRPLAGARAAVNLTVGPARGVTITGSRFSGVWDAGPVLAGTVPYRAHGNLGLADC